MIYVSSDCDVQEISCQFNNGSDVLSFYGIENVKPVIEQNENSLYLSIMADFAKEFMLVNEFREKILSLKPLDDEELAKLIEENLRFGSRSKRVEND